MMSHQIAYSFEYVEIHEQEVIRHVEQYYPMADALQSVSEKGSQIEQ